MKRFCKKHIKYVKADKGKQYITMPMLLNAFIMNDKELTREEHDYLTHRDVIRFCEKHYKNHINLFDAPELVLLNYTFNS